MEGKIRVRFAPSPTGHLHLGNVRTALFNWLFAKAGKGTFVLRIEDTDAERSTEASAASVIDDLKWLGLVWDEGPEMGGDFGPYFQTQRYGTYKDYLDRLVSEGKAYPCYCSQQELDELRAESEARKLPFTYPGTCRRISKEQREKFEAEGRRPAYRLSVTPKLITFRDMVRGPVSINTGTFGDWILTRPDGSPTYNFAVVVDDSLMQITHVIRGEDHLPNTPKQIALYEAMGLTPPTFAHLSMILGPDGSKLSKRHGDVSLDAFRKRGMLPSAMANGLALLGWSDPDGREVFSIEELAARFDISRVNKAAAIFDEGKLRHLNREHIKALSDPELALAIRPYLSEAGRLPSGATSEELEGWLVSVTGLIRDRIEFFSDCLPATDPLWKFDPDEMDGESLAILHEPDAERVIRAFAEKAEVADLALPGGYREVVQGLKEGLKVKGKALFHPIRVALTASSSGPDLETLVPILARGSRLELKSPILGPCQRAWEIISFMAQNKKA